MEGSPIELPYTTAVDEMPDKTLDYRREPPKKRTRWGLLLLLIGVVMIVLLLALIS